MIKAIFCSVVLGYRFCVLGQRQAQSIIWILLAEELWGSNKDRVFILDVMLSSVMK